jgi:hypothetical protein
MPGMIPIWRSSGCANELPIVSALAPGSPLQTPIVGRSTDGSAAIGMWVKATTPSSNTPSASNVVATGLSIGALNGFMPMLPAGSVGAGTVAEARKSRDR